jgi:uncharacterized protein YbjT (DUF2867 family)
MSLPTVFVCGVTGTQGGSVAEQLRAQNVEVHALARDPSSTNAKSMETLGVKLWPGDFDNIDAINSAMTGCNALFLNFMPDFQDVKAELRWAKALMAAAHTAGVKHVVYSSGSGINAPEKRAYWDPDSLAAIFSMSKRSIENEVQNAGFEYWTILRPGVFMSNYINPAVFMYPGLVEKGVWETATTKDTVLPCVDTLTVGRFGSAAFLDPVKFHAKEIEYADELIKVDDLLEKLSVAAGKSLKAVYLSEDEINVQKATNPFVQGQLLMRDLVQFVNLEEVKQWGIPLSSLDAFLEREKKRVLDTYNK